MALRSALPTLAALFLLTGCAGVLDSGAPPETRWWLTPPTLAEAARTDDRALAVHLTVVPGLDSDRILNLNGAARLNHYAGAYWADHLPDLLGCLFVRSLEAGGWDRVREGDYARDGECLLVLEVRAFWGLLGANDVTTATRQDYAGYLECDGDTRTVATDTEVTVTDHRLGAIVAAFQEGLNRSAKDLARQLASP